MRTHKAEPRLGPDAEAHFSALKDQAIQDAGRAVAKMGDVCAKLRRINGEDEIERSRRLPDV